MITFYLYSFKGNYNIRYIVFTDNGSKLSESFLSIKDTPANITKGTWYNNYIKPEAIQFYGDLPTVIKHEYTSYTLLGSFTTFEEFIQLFPEELL